MVESQSTATGDMFTQTCTEETNITNITRLQKKKYSNDLALHLLTVLIKGVNPDAAEPQILTFSLCAFFFLVKTRSVNSVVRDWGVLW